MKLGSHVSAVRSSRVLVGNEVNPAVVVIKDGKIHQILSSCNFPEDVGCEVSWLSPLCVSVTVQEQAHCCNTPEDWWADGAVKACCDCRCWMWGTAW